MKTYNITVETKNSHRYYESETIPYQQESFLVIKAIDNEITLTPVTEIRIVTINEVESS